MEQTPWRPQPPARFPTEKNELLFALSMAVTGLLTANSVLYGGFNLGFTLGMLLSIAFSMVYLLRGGAKPSRYCIALLGLCAVIALGFARSSDGFVKFILFGFLFMGISLGLCLLAGRPRFATGRFQTLGDSFITFFGIGFGELSPSLHGLADSLRNGSRFSRSFGSVLLGLAIAFPLLLVLIPLLISADAAFDGLVGLLPEFDLGEFLGTIFCGTILAMVLYARGTGLRHRAVENIQPRQRQRGLAALTVNTVLGMVCAVYLAYLFSQLAYFFGGFSGLLPQEYTLAEYARRGFFEMAMLCVLNLVIIAVSFAVLKPTEQTPKITRLLCLFIGVISLFLVTAASAKMFLYIESYGLTRLRLLTQIIMLFFGITTAIVMVWLFVPKLPYMKAVILTALIIGALVIWLDVDTIVASYNVNAYLSGKLDLDWAYMCSLNSSSAPHIARLAQEAPAGHIRSLAQNYMEHLRPLEMDLRNWNLADALKQNLLP